MDLVEHRAGLRRRVIHDRVAVEHGRAINRPLRRLKVIHAGEGIEGNGAHGVRAAGRRGLEPGLHQAGVAEAHARLEHRAVQGKLFKHVGVEVDHVCRPFPVPV